MRRYAAGDRVVQAQYGAGTIVDVKTHPALRDLEMNHAAGIAPPAVGHRQDRSGAKRRKGRRHRLVRRAGKEGDGTARTPVHGIQLAHDKRTSVDLLTGDGLV